MGSAFVILAAGQGKRMHSALPKVLHEIAGAPLLVHAMTSARAAGAERLVVVTGKGGEAVENAAKDFDTAAICVRQENQEGTAHAVAQAAGTLADHTGEVIVLYGDTPFIRPDTLARMQAARSAGNGVVVLGFRAADPAGYGRLITGDHGSLLEIVEHKEASDAQRKTDFCNSGVVCVDREMLFSLVAQVGNTNAKNEYYLTDIVALANTQGIGCTAVECPEAETLGVNSRADLAAAEAVFQARARSEAMATGVTLLAPETVHFAFDTKLAADVEVEQNVVFGSGVTVESGATIRAFSHLEGCHIGADARIGPYARLRPETHIGKAARVGNFVEVKAAHIREGAKANHLSYIGDADVGEAANIGAGTITCNYDGVFKHRTKIGPRAFIGSNSALVAPVSIGADAVIASGSVITRDVPAGDLAVGRGRQENKALLGKRFMDRLRALKARMK